MAIECVRWLQKRKNKKRKKKSDKRKKDGFDGREIPNARRQDQRKSDK